MTESLPGGILGAGIESFAGAGTFASAVVAKLAWSDPVVARGTADFPIDQSHLLQIQAEHVKDEYSLPPANLRGQRLGQAIRIGFHKFVVLVATVAGLGVAVMIRDDVTSNRLVDVLSHLPPGLATRGLGAAVVAAGLLRLIRTTMD